MNPTARLLGLTGLSQSPNCQRARAPALAPIQMAAMVNMVAPLKLIDYGWIVEFYVQYSGNKKPAVLS
jgi:hypothetical protein